jgi:uncharacterized protein YndB with AHSA1/START domain
VPRGSGTNERATKVIRGVDRSEVRIVKLDMHMKIDARPEEVFDLMADVGNERDWNPDVKCVRRLDTGPLACGAEWDGDYRGMGTMRIRLDEYERPRRLVFTTTGSRMRMRFGFDLTPARDNATTEVHVRADIVARGLMTLAGPLLGPIMRRTMAKRPAQINAGVREVRARREGFAS